MPEYVETLRLVVDTRDLDRAIADIQRATSQTQRTMTSAGKSMSSDLSGVESAAGAVGKAVGGIGTVASGAAKTVGNAFSAVSTGATVAVGAVTATAVGLAKTGLGYVDLWQKSTAAWTTILGSAEKSRGMMEDLAGFSSKMPFGRATWIQATQQLLGFGVAAEKVIPTLQGVGDAVAATGGGAQDVQDVARILAQVSATGKITGETLMQLGVRGINAAQLIGDQFGKTSTQVQEAITKGTLSGEKGYDALVKGMTEKYAGAGANVSKTFSGMVGGIQSRLRDLGTAIVEPFISKEGGGYIIEWGIKVTDIISNFTKVFGPVWSGIVDTWKPALDGFTLFLSNLGTKLKGVDVKAFVDQIGKLSKYLAPIGAAMLAMGSSNLSGLLGPFGALLPKINPLLAALAVLVLQVPGAADALKEMGKAALDMGKQLATMLMPHLKDLAAWLGPLLEKAMRWVIDEGFPKLLDVISWAVDFIEHKAIPALKDLKDWLWPKLVQAFDWLTKTAWPKVQEVMSNVTAFINDKVLPALTDLKEWLWPKLQAAFEWITKTAWPKVQEVMATVIGFINEKVLPALSDLKDWLWPKLQAAYDWFNAAWPQIQQAMSDVMAFIETEVVPKLAAIYDWLWPNVEAAFTWVTDTAWPALLAAMTTVIDYIKTQAIPNLQLMGQTIVESMTNPRGEGNVAAPGSFLDDLHAIFDNLSASLDAWKRTAQALKDIWDMLMPEQVAGAGEAGSNVNLLTAALSQLLDPLVAASEGFRTISESIASSVENLRDLVAVLTGNKDVLDIFQQRGITNPINAVQSLVAGNPQPAGAATANEDAASTLALAATPVAADAGAATADAFTDGLSTGLTENQKPTAAAATSAMDFVVAGMKLGLGIHSPSTVTMDMGESMMEGLSTGITDNLPLVTTAINKLKDTLTTGMQGITNSMRAATNAIGETVGSIANGLTPALSGAAGAAPGAGEIEAYIRQAASQRGIDPNVAVRVAQSEGGVSEAAKRGTFNTGSSWWPFQLHYGGAGTPYESLGTVAGMGNTFTAQTGFQPGDPAAWQASTDYALDQAAKTGWGQWYGAAASGIGNYQGIPNRDNGGWLMPGISKLANLTGQPERILAPGQGGSGITVNLGGLTINAPGGDGASLGAALPAIAEELASYLADRLGSSLHNLATT